MVLAPDHSAVVQLQLLLVAGAVADDAAVLPDTGAGLGVVAGDVVAGGFVAGGVAAGIPGVGPLVGYWLVALGGQTVGNFDYLEYLEQ